MTNSGTTSTSTSTTSTSSGIYWSPIGLLDMLNTGGAVEQILSSNKGRTAVFLAKGPGRFGIYSTHSPKKVTVDGEDYDFTFERLPSDKVKHDIVLTGESSGVRAGTNMNAEVILKGLINKVGEMSEEVQIFISEASVEYSDLLFSKSNTENGNENENENENDDKNDKNISKDGIINLILKGDESNALPLKLNPLSGVRKVAIYW